MIFPYTSRGVLYAAKVMTGDLAGVHVAPVAAPLLPQAEAPRRSTPSTATPAAFHSMSLPITIRTPPR